MKKTKILYLHGFNSSPQSYKAQQLITYMKQRDCDDLLVCPQLPAYPEQARLFMEKIVEEILLDYHLNVAGSSLGGYYATYLAEKYGTNAVLINPSVKPYETLEAYLGENKFYHSGKFQLQFSIHSTDRLERDRLIPIKKWDFSKISEYGWKSRTYQI